MIIYAVVDTRSSSTHPLGDAVEAFIRREDAERFIEEVRGDDANSRATSGSRSASSRRAG
ncbi:MAG: hypothetical protein ABWY57_00890 [Mycetocola sp.]